LLQIAQDLVGKPLNELRLLDLACCEAHYAIEFALHGARAVGIEYREENLAKARFAKQHLCLDDLELYQDDVRSLSRDRYGEFDLVICSGILYHLDGKDVFPFIRSIYEVCTRVAIFDTQIALHPQEKFEFENRTYHGAWFTEHDESADAETKLKNLWASIDNNRSFWPTAASLANFAERVGFTSFYECLNPYHPNPGDRRAYVAIKGLVGTILSSPATASMGFTPMPEVLPRPSVESSNAAVRLITRTLPRPPTQGLRRAFRSIKPKPFRAALEPILKQARSVKSEASGH
jgi:predicted RNA methylase